MPTHLNYCFIKIWPRCEKDECQEESWYGPQCEMPTMPTDILPAFFAALQGAGDVALLCAAAEQCDDLMGVTNDLSGQRAGGFFLPSAVRSRRRWSAKRLHISEICVAVGVVLTSMTCCIRSFAGWRYPP